MRKALWLLPLTLLAGCALPTSSATTLSTPSLVKPVKAKHAKKPTPKPSKKRAPKPQPAVSVVGCLTTGQAPYSNTTVTLSYHSVRSTGYVVTVGAYVNGKKVGEGTDLARVTGSRITQTPVAMGVSRSTPVVCRIESVEVVQ